MLYIYIMHLSVKKENSLIDIDSYSSASVNIAWHCHQSKIKELHIEKLSLLLTYMSGLAYYILLNHET